ncbi:MAG: tRNA 2-selenouridine(34) synthase MnmH [Bacteriovoracia bacterium]
MSTWNDPELISLFQRDTPLIDVRAPVEFQEGSIPGSINLPLMNDEERKAVGICYKEKGPEAAIELGHKLVNGAVKEERIKAWTDYIKEHPAAEVFCFRGGLRSQISCEWIREQGLSKKALPGGYKRLRRFFLSWVEDAPLSPFVRIGGLTGSGKTNLLQGSKNFIDLEKHANHRGSAFGPRGAQPSQITFENLLAKDLMKFHGQKIVVEDESITLGKIVIPQRIFNAMREAPLVILEVSEEDRLRTIFHDYVKDRTPDFFIQGLKRIEKKLGKSKVQNLSENIIRAFEHPLEMKYHEEWISTLLKEYYDPLYQKDLRYNQDKVVFRGNGDSVLAYLNQS